MRKQMCGWLAGVSLLCLPTLALAHMTASAQFKTVDGKIIHAKIDPAEVKTLKVGDKVELVEVRMLRARRSY